ncbi:hypothetical protein K474DRAFT_1673211 [Panus rudis PR-1116 ss-1]|nr:hypothetical protein K474DRAFT_1673211 [Panus rudis PR-1116 ss-1]
MAQTQLSGSGLSSTPSRWAEFRTRMGRVTRTEKLPRIARAELYHTCQWLRNNPKSNGKPDYQGAVKRFAGLKYRTLSDQYKGKHQAPHEAHDMQMLLGRDGEEVVNEWM